MILLSARAGEESRVEGLEAGADDYLTKPFSASELVARVEAHVKLGRIRREAEDALRHSAQFNEAILNNMGEGLYTVDNQGRVTMMNPAAEAMFGWTLGELREGVCTMSRTTSIATALHFRLRGAPDSRYSTRGRL